MSEVTKPIKEDALLRCFHVAQRAIDDLRRYLYDNTTDRRRAMALRRQADLDALALELGHEHVHKWPRDTWMSDAEDASMAELDREARAVLALLDAAYDSQMDPVVRTAVFRSQDVVRRLVEDARLVRGRLRQIEDDLRWEELESDHWARRAVLDGDLGANPPTFLVDVVAEQRRRIEELEVELAKAK